MITKSPSHLAFEAGFRFGWHATPISHDVPPQFTDRLACYYGGYVFGALRRDNRDGIQSTMDSAWNAFRDKANDAFHRMKQEGQPA